MEKIRWTKQRLTTIILTFNSEAILSRVVEAAAKISSRILVVDSFSTDQTPALARTLGCELIQHPFENYSRQRNWAQGQASLKPDDWVLHLDADEVISPRLAHEIQEAISDPDSADGFLIRKRLYFLGKPIRFGHLNPSWHLRLFRAGKGRCEDRNYDQHFLVEGPVKKLSGILHDFQAATIEAWTQSHNRWSTAEALEILEEFRPTHNDTLLQPSLSSDDPRKQKRWLKNNIYYRVPSFLRAFGVFLYSYIFRLGFLDGKAGLIYHVLQAFWFRFLVDAKIEEMKNANPSPYPRA